MGSTQDEGQGTSLAEMLKNSPAADRLKQEASHYLQQRATGAEELAKGSSPVGAALGAATTGMKEKVKSLFGKGGSTSKTVTNIIEDIDIGRPVSTTYNQWTQFQEFASFMKGVEGVDAKDEVESTWRLKVFKSRRARSATITEQVPDRRICWTTSSAKGSTRGVVTFHPIADDLTKVLLVLEYYPAGFFEKTGNIWRAAGRRARLDLKHFRRFVSMQTGETGSWRGEIRDGEVVRYPEDEETGEDVDQGFDDEYDEAGEDETDDRNEDEDRGEDEADEDEAPEPAPRRRSTRSRARSAG